MFARLLAVMMVLSLAAWPGFAKTMPKTETAIFAGGCFWCMDAAFHDQPGVIKVTSGYTGGHVANPTYDQVSTGKTGHFEAIEVTYDPTKTSYATLLNHFWQNVDPTDPDGQFCDKGSQYGAGVFYTTPEQEKQARESIKPIQNKFSQPLAAFIRKAEPFYPAEEYHQSYAEKNALRYKLYEKGCGRDERLDELKK